MWPFAVDGRSSSTPAYPQQFAPLESSTDACRKDGCDHVEPWVDGQMPAFLWRSAACQRAWMASRGGPVSLSAAKVAPPPVRGVEADLSWLGPPLPRREVPGYNEVAS